MPVYVGARDLTGVAIGTHQFIVITYDHPIYPVDIGYAKVTTKQLGNGVRGIVVGA